MTRALVVLFTLLVGAPPDGAHFHAPDRAPPRSAPAERIVSLAPTATELLFALGAGPRVVGVTRFCDEPAEARTRAQVGGFIDPHLERILGLKPDLVVATPSLAVRATLDEIAARGVPVLVGYADTLAQMVDLGKALGRATGTSARADEIARGLEDGVRALAARGESRAVRALALVDGGARVAAGPGTYLDHALAICGATNVLARETADTTTSAGAWPTVSVEGVLARAPAVVVLTDGRDGKGDALVASLAVLGPRAPRVIAFDPPLLARMSPRFVVETERLCRALRADQP
jgi:iron complex transport system substrate-binding protein